MAVRDPYSTHRVAETADDAVRSMLAASTVITSILVETVEADTITSASYPHMVSMDAARLSRPSRRRRRRSNSIASNLRGAESSHRTSHTAS